MGQTFVYNTGKAEEEKGTFKLAFGVFIDGTLNNKDNTDLRNKHARGSETNPDYTLSNKEIEKLEADAYDKVKNKKRIAALLENKYRSPAEQAELDAVPDKDRYLVASHRTWLDKQGTDNSFSNDYSNVARMWKYCKKSPYSLYVEGMGTDKASKDSQDGFAFGAGLTGIRARVRNGCEQIAELIVTEKRKQKDNKLTNITLDVFGFSRGAASARNFVHEVQLKSGYGKVRDFDIPDGFYPINPHSTREDMPKEKYRRAKVDVDEMEVDESYLVDGRLPQMGHLGYQLLKMGVFDFEQLKDITVTIRFIGLYDTVSSYFEQGGIGEYDVSGNIQDGGLSKILNEATGTNFNTNVDPLKLNQLGSYQQLVHFTAKNEHRRNFSLTRVPSANIVNHQGNIKTVERNFPGVHCDIGGAYMNEKEVVDEIGTSLSDGGYNATVFDALPGSSIFHKTGLRALKQDLINQYWYKEEELEIKIQLGYIPPFTTFWKLTGTRNLKKEYSYIPLHFMEEYAVKTPMKDYFTFSIVDAFPLDSFLKNVKEHLHDYVFGEDIEWEFVPDEVLEERKKEREEKERSEIEFEKSLLAHNLVQKPVYDNLDPTKYQPDVILQQITTIEPEPEKSDAIELETITVAKHSPHKMLRKLRNEYLHWSANRDWFGMEPNDDRKRVEF
jgi:hypothetical protein